MSIKQMGLWTAGAIILTGSAVMADVKLPEIFNDNMVIQRDTNAPVWGWAAPGEKVTVTGSWGKSAETTTPENGKWEVKLATPNAGGPFTITVQGKNKIELKNVLSGEVWICSGQSNMQWSVSRSNNAKEEIANAKYPQIRLFHVKRAWKTTPQIKLTATWKVCTPANIPNFTAVGYFFGRELHKTLKVPVGLINSSWGGTRIEPWTPPVGFAETPALKAIYNQIEAKTAGTSANKKLLQQAVKNYKNWLVKAEAALENNTPINPPTAYPAGLVPYHHHQSPTVLYNAMINPMVPYAMRGAIWYQGESNRGDGKVYGEKMKALINGWRSVYNNENLAFFFVQLAPYNYRSRPFLLPAIWEAQVEVALTVPGTGIAIINDIGNIKNIHPTNKQDVGKRLALLALNKTYGKKDVVCDSPAFKEMKIEGNAIKVSFANAKSLKTRDGKAPSWFEICGADGLFKKADAKIDGNVVVVTAEGVAKPCVVRYAWHMLAEPNLANEAGLPASAFRAGKVPELGALNTFIPEAKDFKIVYIFDPSNPKRTKDGKMMVYSSDKRADIIGEVEKIGYALILNNKDYVFVSMDPFTKDLNKVGVPTVGTKAVFQQKIKNMFVKSNVKGIKNGTFADGGNIEFWSSNYGGANTAKVPGASNSKYDFGDQPSGAVLGYGSMQIHNFKAKQTVFAFNSFRSGKNADLGIGNSSGKTLDWTFSKNAGKYKSAKMYIMVKTK
jgi:sialate O-acetylesterase